MATTSPDNLRTPDPGDPYNLVPDLATLAGDTQSALLRRSVQSGTAAERIAFTSTATNGWLWQDTDSIKMIWRKDGAAWVPAVWRWSGTAAQMNAFTQAPNGFKWFNTTDNSEYVYNGSGWYCTKPLKGGLSLASPSSGAAASEAISFPSGYFAEPPHINVALNGGMSSNVTVNYGPTDITANGFTLYMARSNTTVTILRWQAVPNL